MTPCGHMIAPACGCGPDALATRPGAEAPVEDAKPARPKNARHSKENPDWQTPEEEIARARTALGGRIGLDPFSCALGNARVCAQAWYGPDHPDPQRRDGFAPPWIADTVFENHPGGTTARSWRKTLDEWIAGNYRELVWMGFSIEQVCVLSDPNERRPDGRIETDAERWARGAFVPTDFSICYLRKRISFIDANDPERPPRPSHANYVLGIGVDLMAFDAAYMDRGQVVHGPLAGAEMTYAEARARYFDVSILGN